MKFLTKLRTESIPGTDDWLLIDHLLFEAADGRLYRVPEGSVTDFFSIPGLLRSFMFRARKYCEAAVMHDGAYRGTLEVANDGEWEVALVTKRYADTYLLVDPAAHLGAPRTLLKALKWGVRVGGKRSFKGAITKSSKRV